MINEFREKILADISAGDEEGIYTAMLAIFDGEIAEGSTFEEARRGAVHYLTEAMEWIED